jgi:hypothetical protein
MPLQRPRIRLAGFPPGPRNELAVLLGEVKAVLLRARHRLGKMLLRRGLVHCGKAWTQAHDYWLLKQSFPLAGTQAAFQDAYETVVLAAGRRDRVFLNLWESYLERD